MGLMRRRRFLVASNALLLAPLLGRAKEGERLRRVGWLWGGRASALARRIVEEELRQRGWLEGKNITFEHRIAEGRNDRLQAFAAELVRDDVSVILASQSTATTAAKRATRTIPIVMVGNGDPVRYGLVSNLARPEANVTGVSFLVNELGVKLLELLKEVHPRLAHLAVFVNPSNPGAASYGEAVQAAAGLAGVRTALVRVTKAEEFGAAFESILREKVDTLLLPPEGLIASQRAGIVKFANRHGMVVGGNHAVFANAGAVVSYAPPTVEIARRAAAFVDRILRGAKPADLPVEQPTRFEVVINLQAAKALGLSIPASVLLRADRVIE